MAAAAWLHRLDTPDGRHGRRHLQDVVHQFHHRQKPLLRRNLSRIEAHERIRYTDEFDDPTLPGEMQTTVTLKQVSCGTELNITQEGVPAAIPIEACYLGWQESLTLLAKLVEAEIPDEQ